MHSRLAHLQLRAMMGCVRRDRTRVHHVFELVYQRGCLGQPTSSVRPSSSEFSGAFPPPSDRKGAASTSARFPLLDDVC
eukprot:scaffold79061_cov30-Tisochrysis_lutea.AAC.7